jgi:carbon-monoxide dehydrogenase medium subunit
MYGGDILIPGSFDYLAAHSVNEAVTLLDRHGEGAKVLAGGRPYSPLRFRLASPTILIDINHIDGLEYLRREWRITHWRSNARVGLDKPVSSGERYPILFETDCGSRPCSAQLGWIGGNIAHADLLMITPLLLAMGCG